MASLEKLKRKLCNVFKLSGFNVRREFCNYIIDKSIAENINLNDTIVFDGYVKKLCNALEKQCVSEKSIEQSQIERAVELCLHSGYDKEETIFAVIGAFDFPKMVYDLDRKLYFLAQKKSKFLSEPDSKTQLFVNRYTAIMQRTRRNFHKKQINTESANKLVLQTIDFLLTSSIKKLDNTLILGSLLQVAEGKYWIEDPTGMVQLDLSHAKYHGGFVVENGFILVNGLYEDKILQVSSVLLPPGEEYKESRLSFGNLNYFGGASPVPLRDSLRLKENLRQNPHDMILFFSDVWLDNNQTFPMLELLFNGMQTAPPVAFVFMGNFMSESLATSKIELMRKLFKQLGELIARYPTLVDSSEFVFVPGMLDPCTPHMVPRIALPKYVTEELSNFVPKAIFTTNPCRLQYCNKEITVFRADLLVKLMQCTLNKPKKEDMGEYLTKTLISQGHLSPLSLNALTVHWDFDHTLSLYPVPDLVVVGDVSENYVGSYKGCQVINPGPFAEYGFQFKCYFPFSDTIEDCAL